MKVLFRLCLSASLAVMAVMLLRSYPTILYGTGMDRVPEMMFFGYSVAEARMFFETISDAGRAQYLGMQALLDWAFPALVALTLIFAILRWSRLVPMPRRIFAVVLALAAMGADYWENFQIAAALRLPVDQITDKMLQQMSLTTQGKTYLAIAAILVTSGVVLGGLIRTWRRRRR